MSVNGLSPPGSAIYSSSTMYVGDGTWDTERNDFLLPNLQGLNFATMQYNGMGNRFRDIPEYHVLIIGHGVLAAIVFIFMIPTAIFIARFWHSESRIAFKMHVYIQILVVFLSTVVLILGWFAVGPNRSLTNPHHGIGVALYTCILVQFLWGWLMYKRERKRKEPPVGLPLKVHIHKLFGRAIAILGFVQIALGLTLYGSPKALFVLYALAGVLLLFIYLTLSYRQDNRLGVVEGGRRPARSDYYSDYDGSYVSGTQTATTAPGGRQRKEESHWGRNLLAAGGLVGAYEWLKHKRGSKNAEKEGRYTARPDSRLSRQSRYTDEDSRLDRPGGRPPGDASQYGASSYGPSGRPDTTAAPTESYMSERPGSRRSRRARMQSPSRITTDTWERDDDDEKYDQRPAKHTWRDRLLGAGAGVVAFQGIKSIFGRNKDGRDDNRTNSQSYRPPLGGNQNMVSQSDVSRVESGQAPMSPEDRRRRQDVQMDTLTPMTPTRPPARRRPSRDSMDYSEDESYSAKLRPQATNDRTLKDSIAALGVVAGMREWNKQRKQRRINEQDERIRQQELEDEQRFKRNSASHYPLPEHAQGGRRTSMSGTLLTGPEQEMTQGSNPQLSRQSFRPDTMHPPLPAAAGAIPMSTTPSNVGPARYGQDADIPQPQQLHTLPPPPPGQHPNAARPTDYQAPAPGSLEMPQGAINPDPSRLLHDQRPPQGTDHAAEAALTAGAVGAAFGAAAQQRAQSQSPSRYNVSRTRLPRPGRQESVGSASVSQANSASGPAGSNPPISVKVNLHNDGQVTLRRLNVQEAAAEREARQRDRRTRRGSSLSSGGEDAGSRYRRSSAIRPSNQQPIAAVPPIPSMSNSLVGAGYMDMPIHAPRQNRLPQASISPPVTAASSRLPVSPPPRQNLSPATGPAGSGYVGSPGNVMSDAGTGTDVSAFDSNRRRRRAERARRDAAAKGGPRVEFE